MTKINELILDFKLNQEILGRVKKVCRSMHVSSTPLGTLYR